MTTIKRLINFVFVLTLLSCSSSRVKTLGVNYNDCKIYEISTSTEYKGLTSDIAIAMRDFNNSSNVVDIIRIKSASGYDIKEEYKRVFVANDKLFLDFNSTKKEIVTENLSEIINFFKSVRSKNIYVNCKNISSTAYDYQFFVKVNNELVISFSSNDKLEDINPNIISEELKIINYFEDIK